MLVEVDETTVTAAVAGDADALARLLQTNAGVLQHHFTSRIGRRYQAALSAEDVLQVTFMEAFLRIRSFAWNGAGSVLAWLRHIGENNLRDAIRELDAEKRPAARKRVALPLREDTYTTFLATFAASGTTPTQHVRKGEAKTILEKALCDLPPDYSKAIRLYDLEERHVDEVARSFDPPRTRGSVHMLRARGMDCLRELLGQPDRLLTTQA